MYYVLFFKQKTAYEMRISDWRSDLCTSHLEVHRHTFFPFHKDRQSAKAALNGHEKCGCAPTAAVQTLILDTIKPFEDGGHHLYGVHKLDIADKHHMLIPTQAAMVIHQIGRAHDGTPVPNEQLVCHLTTDKKKNIQN